MTHGAREGVIKFQVEHERVELAWHDHAPVLAALSAWREVLRRLEVLGQVPHRYDGLGFGNLSARLPARTRAAGHRRFVVTCTQTSGSARLEPSEVCIIERYELATQRVWSRGPCLPSSEAMTHAALYDADSELSFVFHVHAAAIWRAAVMLGLPETGAEAEYGTPAMAREVRRIYNRGAGRRQQLIVMRGHEDGVVAFGRTADEAGTALVNTLTAAWTRESTPGWAENTGR